MTPESAVSFVTVRRRFDFRSIEVGRWVTPQERGRAAGRFYQALCDLMTILRGPEPLISLRSRTPVQVASLMSGFTPLITTWVAKLTGMPDRSALPSPPVPG